MNWATAPYIHLHVETNVDETSAIAATRQGSVSSFNQLVRTYQELVYHTAYRMLGDGAMASDVTQATFHTAYRQINKFRGDSFQVWLLRIATNHCYNQLRDKQLTISDNAPAYPADWRLQSGSSQELGTAIQQGLLSLPPIERMTCVLADLVGLDHKQIAEIIGTNPDTVNLQLSRARRRLRDVLLGSQGN